MNDISLAPVRKVGAGPTLLYATAAIGFALWMGLFLLRGPVRAVNHDELNHIHDGLRLVYQGTMQSYAHGPLIYELVGLTEGLLYLLGRALGVVDDPFDFLVWVLQDERAHLAVGRGLTLIFGFLTIVQVRRIGEIFGGPWAGALSATLCAANLTFLAMSSVCKEDTLLWSLLLGGCAEAWAAVQTASTRRAWISGLLVGAAVSAKLFGIFGWLLVALPWLVSSIRDRATRTRLSLAIAGGAAIGLLVTYPFLLWDGRRAVASVSQLSASLSDMEGVEDHLALGPSLVVHLPNMLGVPVLLGALAELGLLLASKRRAAAALLVVPASLLTALGLRRGHLMAYYLFPVAAFAMVLFAALIVRIMTRPGPRWVRVGAIALFLGALVHPAFLTGAAKHGITMLALDTRVEAESFLERAVAPSDCVTVTNGLAGMNFWGPRLFAREPRPSSGPFAIAERIVWRGSGHPLLDVRVIDGGVPSRLGRLGCRWLAIPTFLHSPTELGRPAPPPNLPSGATEVGRFAAVPERSCLFPYYTEADYAALQALTLGEVWRRARMGWTLDIYELAP